MLIEREPSTTTCSRMLPIQDENLVEMEETLDTFSSERKRRNDPRRSRVKVVERIPPVKRKEDRERNQGWTDVLQVKNEIATLQVARKGHLSDSERGVFDWSTICRSLDEAFGDEATETAFDSPVRCVVVMPEEFSTSRPLPQEVYLYDLASIDVTAKSPESLQLRLTSNMAVLSSFITSEGLWYDTGIKPKEGNHVYDTISIDRWADLSDGHYGIAHRNAGTDRTISTQ
ncbi:hypothetical protein GCK32_006431 [Trichostrongylus colubriformis]|uniref:Uncharacterized protein n=1 Tax=Trichostrongylus colubriformis TaxID=6319 RepID=A0AAN8EZY8_TRICO